MTFHATRSHSLWASTCCLGSASNAALKGSTGFPSRSRRNWTSSFTRRPIGGSPRPRPPDESEHASHDPNSTAPPFSLRGWHAIIGFDGVRRTLRTAKEWCAQ